MCFFLFSLWGVWAGTIAPINGNKYPDVYARIPWISQWLDLDVVVPLIALIIVVTVGILVICVAFSRRGGPESRTGTSKDVYCRFWCWLMEEELQRLFYKIIFNSFFQILTFFSNSRWRGIQSSLGRTWWRCYHGQASWHPRRVRIHCSTKPQITSSSRNQLQHMR